MSDDIGIAELYRNASDAFGVRVDAIRGDQWNGPTPCTEWDVRKLVDHLVGEVAWVPPLVGGRSVADVGDELSGDLLGDDPKAAWADRSSAAVAAVEADGALDGVVTLSKRQPSVPDYLFEVFMDLAIHSWDLARAIGADERIDPEAVDILYERMKPMEADLKASGAFGPEVAPPPGADRQTELLALFGRVA
jgi:uncharacterized protein (TIGR03086 family)